MASTKNCAWQAQQKKRGVLGQRTLKLKQKRGAAHCETTVKRGARCVALCLRLGSCLEHSATSAEVPQRYVHRVLSEKVRASPFLNV